MTTRIAAAAALLAARAALASPFDLYGFSARGVGSAGALTAIGDDVSAAYYNPSAVVGTKDVELLLGFSFGQPFLSIDHGVDGGKNLPRCSPDSAATPCDHIPEGLGDFVIGAVLPMGGKLKHRAALTLAFNLPAPNLVRVQSLDASEPQFYMYNSQPDRFALFASLAVKLLDELSVSAGVQALASFDGHVNFAMELFNRQFKKRELTNNLQTVVSPVVGLTFKKGDFRAGLAWRGEMQLAYALPVAVDLGAIGALKLDVHGIAHWTPHVVDLGVGYKVTDALSLDVDLGYEMWSRAPNDQVFVGNSLQGDALIQSGLADVLSFSSHDPAMGFSDVLVARAGAEYAVSELFSLRGGVGYRPSPVPDQEGATNYLDNATVTVAGGFSVGFADPLEIFERPITIDVGVEYLAAIPRAYHKQQSADPAGNYAFGGGALDLAAAVRYRW